jgi:hypothetical protein
VHAVLRHQEGRLQDDATLLVVQWQVDGTAQFGAPNRPLFPDHVGEG